MQAPKKSGVYLITEGSFDNYNPKLVYIGSSLNLYDRYRNHNIISKISSLGLIHAFYFKEYEKGFYDIEIELIREFKPKYNKNLYGSR
jgi:excinuclease UvrABC nuclease subunit